MKILALDYGVKNIGLALTDVEGNFAFAYDTLRVETQNFASLQKIIADLKNICAKEKVEKIIIGLPVQLSGENSSATVAVFEFVKQLEQGIGLPVETIDERWSTMQAHKISRDRSRPVRANNIDALSAQILLQGYLEKIRITN
ncbi:MAG TPA: Holliday junction resolvase RuvX [bacterium]|nr:Holliday junction resolvase RuvX [bacterium]HPL95202.1 Holliday junction resolvase RuvX [bacterium]